MLEMSSTPMTFLHPQLDMTAGYHQIRMMEADEYKTTFKTHHGHF